MSTLVPDEISMEDLLCDSSFGSMVTLDYVTPDTLSDLDEDNWIQESQSSRPSEDTSLSEEAKKNMHAQGNVESSELRALSEKVQCGHCLRYSRS